MPRSVRHVVELGLVVMIVASPEGPKVTLESIKTEGPLVALPEVIILVFGLTKSVHSAKFCESFPGEGVDSNILHSFLPSSLGVNNSYLVSQGFFLRHPNYAQAIPP